MATVTADRAAASFPAFRALGAGILCAAYGTYDFAAEPAAATILEICRVPAGAVVLGGFIRMGDMDSHDSETVDIDVGYAANGDVAADASAFGNFGVQTGDAVVGYLPEGGVLLPLHGSLAAGPISFTRETVITVTFVDDPATFGAGEVTVVVYYVCP